jgi:hypothetical protein
LPFPGKSWIIYLKVTVLEPENTRARATCCGDSFYGALPVEQVKEQR